MALIDQLQSRWKTNLISICAGVLVGAVVASYVLAQPAQYEGRVALLAVPAVTVGDGSNSGQYGEVVSLGLPALTELARSPSTLSTVAKAEPDSPPADELFGAISVELITSSSVARLTVRAGSADLAGRLAERLARTVIAANVFAPAADLRALDQEADVRQVAPDVTLGLGLTLMAAVLAALATAFGLRLLRTSGTGPDTIHSTLVSAGQRTAAVLDGRDPVLVNRIVVLQQASNRPLRLVAVGPGLDGRIASLGSQLNENSVRMSVNGDAVRAAVVAVMDRRRGRPEDLASAVSALPRDSVLVAVVLG